MASFGTSVRDTLQVARFHVLRALRTRTVVFLCVVYVIASTGMAWIFRHIVHELETNLAKVLGVPATETPGAMLDSLKAQPEFADLLRGLLPDEALLDWAMSQPVLAISYFWMALGMLPFLAAAAGAEVVADGIKDRSLRFELVRTGRLELILGRFLGQAVLVGVATAASAVGPFCVAVFFMANQPPLDQASALLLATPRLLAWSLPFLGIGVACSQLTGSTNAARTLALGAAVSTWVLSGILETRWLLKHAPVLADLIEPVLPQTYMLSLWGPGMGWLSGAAIVTGLGLVYALASFPLFRRRKL